MINNQSITEQMTVAICTYNSVNLLPRLMEKLQDLVCPIPFEILIIDNNSTDNTIEVIEKIEHNCTAPIRYVRETEQGIPFARNRAIEESLHNRYMAFIDADELPGKNWLQAALHGLQDMQAECVGGKITLQLPHRPSWLTNQLTPFLGEIDHGNQALTVVDRTTPVWSGNVAYRTAIFQDGLRFDTRYNRKGKGIGGGSDGIMFRHLLQNKAHIRYEPEMHIIHLIEPEKLKRSYFLILHYKAGLKAGLYEHRESAKEFFSIPRFMYLLLAQKILHFLKLLLTRNKHYMREAMNTSYHIGMMKGIYLSNHTQDHD